MGTGCLLGVGVVSWLHSNIISLWKKIHVESLFDYVFFSTMCPQVWMTSKLKRSMRCFSDAEVGMLFVACACKWDQNFFLENLPDPSWVWVSGDIVWQVFYFKYQKRAADHLIWSSILSLRGVYVGCPCRKSWTPLLLEVRHLATCTWSSLVCVGFLLGLSHTHLLHPFQLAGTQWWSE